MHTRLIFLSYLAFSPLLYDQEFITVSFLICKKYLQLDLSMALFDVDLVIKLVSQSGLYFQKKTNIVLIIFEGNDQHMVS